MCKVQSKELAFHLLGVLVLIQEKCLALAFAVDRHNHVRQGRAEWGNKSAPRHVSLHSLHATYILKLHCQLCAVGCKLPAADAPVTLLADDVCCADACSSDTDRESYQSNILTELTR